MSSLLQSPESSMIVFYSRNYKRPWNMYSFLLLKYINHLNSQICILIFAYQAHAQDRSQWWEFVNMITHVLVL
jgi:hypothetical protein